MGLGINKLCYTCSNERIEAVIAGLGMNSPSHPDRVLAIGGSGDVAFALLPYVRRIVVVDNNEAQVLLMRERAKQLTIRDYSSFLNYAVRGSCDGNDDDFLRRKSLRTNYFTQKGLLELISSQIDKLVILDPCDLLEALKIEDEPYNGMYMSNVLGTLPSQTQAVPAYLMALQHKLDSNGVGLLYVSDGDQISTIKVPPIMMGDLVIPSTILPLGLYSDDSLTVDARRFGGSVAGLPTVYRNGCSLFQR